MGYQPRLTKEILEQIHREDYNIKVSEARESFSRLTSIIKFLRLHTKIFRNLRAYEY